jgi:NO-binding membrane sensor protein with MHYT domain
MNLALGFFYGLLAQALTFAQLQGQFRYEWMKEHPLIVACIGGVPISLLYIFSVKHMVAHFDGQMWPSRLLGFAIGAIVFTGMSWAWFKEPLSIKTLVCLGLAFCIMIVQLFWK